ncbi:MAG TPA: Ku protein [Polyangiales bacterium]|nr:Ku protein [Polyangiales bacterium]
MAMRATWKGVIELGKQSLPVKLYSAVQDRAVHFHVLHDRDQTRVEQRLVNPKTDEALEKEEIQKGFQLAPGKFVILKQQELKKLAPEASRSIELVSFLPDSALIPAWFERPYLLGPDGDAGEYLALARALRSSERQAIVRWVMRGRGYSGALRARDDEHLILISLRSREEVLEIPELNVPKARAPSEKELALAEQLVAALEGKFDPSQFHDEYRERLREYVAQKAAGKHPRLHKPRARKASGDSLESILRASMKRTHNQERKSA